MTTCMPSEPARPFRARLVVFVIVLIFFVVIIDLGCPPPVAIPLALAGAAVARVICDPTSVPWRRLNWASGQENG